MRKAMILTGLLFLIQAASLPAKVAEVGGLGNPDRFIYKGLETFSAGEVKRGLLLDPYIQRAATPSAPLSAFLDCLRKRIYQGYLHAGFPYARVDAERDKQSGRIVVEVEEGRRFTADSI